MFVLKERFFDVVVVTSNHALSLNFAFPKSIELLLLLSSFLFHFVYCRP
jgi:hypothetical protein